MLPSIFVPVRNEIENHRSSREEMDHHIVKATEKGQMLSLREKVGLGALYVVDPESFDPLPTRILMSNLKD